MLAAKPHAIVLQPPMVHELQHMKLTSSLPHSIYWQLFKELQTFVKLSTRASSTQYPVVIAP